MSRKLSGIRAIVISEQNFETLKKYYSFEDYLNFYDQHFSSVPVPEIEGITLDEPILIQGEDQIEDEDY